MNQQTLLTVDGLNITLTRKSGQKHTYIRVNPPYGDVTVSAPQRLSIEEVEAIVRKNMAKILEGRKRFQEQPRQTKREYVSGETLYLWGNQFMLRVMYAKGHPKVEKFPGLIKLYVPEGSSIEKRRKILMEWYRHELRLVLPYVIAHGCERVGVVVMGWNIRNMRTRWGSCNITRKRILLNLQLVKKPLECLELVVIHELVHLLERKHNRRFWSLVEKFYPHWKDVRDLLNSLPLDYEGWL